MKIKIKTTQPVMKRCVCVPEGPQLFCNPRGLYESGVVGGFDGRGGTGLVTAPCQYCHQTADNIALVTM